MEMYQGSDDHGGCHDRFNRIRPQGAAGQDNIGFFEDL
jgi:hypothetical protein